MKPINPLACQTSIERMISDDMVFTEEYSVRAARIAIYTLFNVTNKEICPVTSYNKDAKVLLKALKKSFE